MNKAPPFENRMTKAERVLGWLYLPLHAAVIPILLSLYVLFDPNHPPVTTVNLFYYAAGAVILVCGMFRFFRAGFDTFLDAPVRCLLALPLALVLALALDVALSSLLLLFGISETGPNNAAVTTLAQTDYGTTKAMAVFLAPLVEEALFRGTVFGTIRPKSRVWAYVASIALFGLYHVWQYAAAWGDPRQLLYALEYIPMAFALAWCYDRTGSIWTSVFFHMGVNALAFRLNGLS